MNIISLVNPAEYSVGWTVCQEIRKYGDPSQLSGKRGEEAY